MQGISNKAGIAVGSGPLPSSGGIAAAGGRRLILAAVAIALCFAKPLFDLTELALKEEIYSHLILIPVISIYLIWQKRKELPAARLAMHPLAIIGGAVGLGLVALSYGVKSAGPIELLSIRILAFWILLQSALLAAGGMALLRSILFPVGFLAFMVPLPPSVIDPLETISKIASTEVFTWMMDITQSTYLRQGFVFVLPGLSIEVAQECSGIRSSLVLFIVSVLASNLFLTTTWKRVLFALFVIPLGFARNAFRIFTLATLSVHWDRSVLDSPLHHKGGPFFFALSLIPFFLVLFWLRKTEKVPPAEIPTTAS